MGTFIGLARDLSAATKAFWDQAEEWTAISAGGDGKCGTEGTPVGSGVTSDAEC